MSVPIKEPFLLQLDFLEIFLPLGLEEGQYGGLDLLRVLFHKVNEGLLALVELLIIHSAGQSEVVVVWKF